LTCAPEISPDSASKFAATGFITGFGPFPGVRHNPSESLARRLAQAHIWRRLGWKMHHRVFSTRYSEVAEAIAAESRANVVPAFVLMLGVAARAKELRVELRARNRVSMTLRDAGHTRPGKACLEPGAKAVRPGRHPGAPLVKVLRRGGVKARLSRDAGHYVCNAAYWQMLGAMTHKTNVVFVYIPMPAAIGSKKRDARPSMAQMEHALTALILTMIHLARTAR
jgi:pyroglutamyl-peptidase